MLQLEGLLGELLRLVERLLLTNGTEVLEEKLSFRVIDDALVVGNILSRPSLLESLLQGARIVRADRNAVDLLMDEVTQQSH